MNGNHYSFSRFRAYFLGFLMLSCTSSPLWAQENETVSSNNTPGTGQLINSFPNQLTGSLESGDVDFWTIPDGTADTLQLLDIFNVNLLFSSVQVDLYAYTDAARTTGLVTTPLTESSTFILEASKYYSLRISGNNSTPAVNIPNSISTFSSLLGLVNSIQTQVDNLVSQYTNVPPFLNALQTGLNILSGALQFSISIGFVNLPPAISNTVETALNSSLSNSVDAYALTFVQSSGSSGSGSALPVVWADFSAELEGAGVVLSWATASEQNNAGFLVEYSQDAITWDALGFVEGNGTSLEMNTYSFTHQTPGLGYNYYRLKQTDFNGDSAYSEIRELVNPGSSLQTAFQVYPNPTVDLLNVSPMVGRLFLRDLTGKILQEKTAQGTWTQLDVSSFSSGVYLLQLYPERGEASSFQILKK